LPDTIVLIRRLAADPDLPRGVRVRLLLLLTWDRPFGWRQRGPIIPPGPIICCIIAGIPSRTNPVTSLAWSRIA
jgi:hypothetical protein